MLLGHFSIMAHGSGNLAQTVEIQFAGLNHQTYYTTLLSKEPILEGVGAFGRTLEDCPRLIEDDPVLGTQAWYAYGAYIDSDGFYFLEVFEKNNDQDTYMWIGQPPSQFKVLVYVPSTDGFYVSDICEPYEWNSFFDVTLDGDHLVTSNDDDYRWEQSSMGQRIIIGGLIELFVALLFAPLRHGQNRIWLIMAGLNLVTQLCVHLMLQFSYPFHQMTFLYYLLLCILFTLVEATVYSYLFKKSGITNQRVAYTFAAVANLLSFISGVLLGFTRLDMF